MMFIAHIFVVDYSGYFPYFSTIDYVLYGYTEWGITHYVAYHDFYTLGLGGCCYVFTFFGAWGYRFFQQHIIALLDSGHYRLVVYIVRGADKYYICPLFAGKYFLPCMQTVSSVNIVFF